MKAPVGLLRTPTGRRGGTLPSPWLRPLTRPSTQISRSVIHRILRLTASTSKTAFTTSKMTPFRKFACSASANLEYTLFWQNTHQTRKDRKRVFIPFAVLCLDSVRFYAQPVIIKPSAYNGCQCNTYNLGNNVENIECRIYNRKQLKKFRSNCYNNSV